MKKQIGIYFFIFGFLVAEIGNHAQLNAMKWWSFMRRFWRSTVLGTGIYLIAAINVSYGQASSATVAAPTTTNTSTSVATNFPAYTVMQLTNLLNAKIDPKLFAYQIGEWGVKLDVSTILNLQSNGVSGSDLQRLEVAVDSQSALIPENADTNTGSDTNLDIHIVQVASLFKNSFPITNIAGYFSQCGMKLDAATIFNLDKAGVTLTNIQALEQFIATQAAGNASQMATQAVSNNLQFASLKLGGVTNLNLAAITNLSMAATNVPMARTNLLVVADYAQQMTTNLSVLQTNDTQEFSFVTNNLEDIASGIRGYAANLTLETNFSASPYQAFITVGAEFLNPYAISVLNPSPYGQGVLTNAGNHTVGFVEFDYINRHILRATGRETTEGDKWYDFGGKWLVPTEAPPDIQFNIGFLFDNSSGITNQSYSAQSLAGADFYSRLDLGFPIWRLDLPTQSHQVSIEVGGGVGTQQSFEQIHPNAFAGLGYETSFSPFLQSSFTNNCGFFEAKAGAGWVDVPSLVGTNNLVNLDGNGSPIFNIKPACELETYLAYPLTSKMYLTVEAVDYLNQRPPQSWNVKVGVSVPLDGVTGVFSSLVNSVGGSQ